MNPRCLLFLSVVWALVFNALLAAAPAVLTLNDLRDHPERWPAKLTLPQDFKFNGGAVARKGQVVQVVELKGPDVLVDAGKDLVFTVQVAGSDFLATANTAWSALTPAQREIDANALKVDPSLWPLRVKSLNPMRLQNGTALTRLLTISR